MKGGAAIIRFPVILPALAIAVFPLSFVKDNKNARSSLRKSAGCILSSQSMPISTNPKMIVG